MSSALGRFVPSPPPRVVVPERASSAAVEGPERVRAAAGERVAAEPSLRSPSLSGSSFPPWPPSPPSPPPRRLTIDFGELADAAADPSATDLVLGGDGVAWADHGAGLERAGPILSPADARTLAVRLIAAGGRHLDDATPFADVHLGGGIRVHAVLPPATPGGALLSIRFPSPEPPSLDRLEALEMVTLAEAALLRRLVAERRNLLVTGPAGSGKTTLLGALLGLVPNTERIVVIEDVAELRASHPHLVRLEARQPNLEGAGAIGLDRLLREALRMRPDRLVVGECRGPETRELLSALNTGHEGGAGTLHANSLEAVPARLEALGAVAGLDAAALARQGVAAIDAVVHLERHDGRRRVSGIGRPHLRGGVLGIERVAAEQLQECSW